MKNKLFEQREKAIIESFANTFNKIKRLDENEVPPMNEINIRKGLAALGLATALATSPQQATAQKMKVPHKEVSSKQMADSTDEFAGKTLIQSYYNNPVTASKWAKRNGPAGQKLLKSIKSTIYATKKNPNAAKQLGTLYKKTQIAKSFIDRDLPQVPPVKPKEDYLQ